MLLNGIPDADGATPEPIAPADPVVRDPTTFDRQRPIERELDAGVVDGFTLSAVGDCIITRPLTPCLGDEGFAAVIDILRRGDVVYGNLETSLIDMDRFEGYPYSWDADYPIVSHPAVAQDLAELGFQIMSRANNHALDWGIEGMRQTSRRLDAAGIVHAGTGEHAGVARAPRYLETARGRVGLVSFASTFLPTSEALTSQTAAPGRPGVSTLKLHRKWIVPASVAAALATLPAPPAKGNAAPGELSRFDLRFVTGAEPGNAYDIDREDAAAILRSIRLGKQHSDFLIAALHSHEARNEQPWPAAPLLPPECLRPLAHAAIDAGADAFVTAGTHNLGPIEVYHGKPVFYGMGNFFWSDLQAPLSADLYHHQAVGDLLARAFEHPERATDADLTAVYEAAEFAHEWVFETMLTRSTYAGGRLAEIAIYPVWLRYGERLTRSGIPQAASPERAKRILKWLRRASEPYGTKIVVKGGVGYVRPAGVHAPPGSPRGPSKGGDSV
jgi:poly-gamma-glutamate capsule biosynthesis protein CapA/YwtB (metallophosphatase superfamily)